MRCATLTIFVLAGCVAGQVPDSEAAVKKLTSSLAALKAISSTQASHRERITNDIMAVSEESHRPSRSTVGAFADGLISTLFGRQLSDPYLSHLATGIHAVLHSAGEGTSTFRQSVSRVENALISLGVSASAAQKVVAELEAVGKEVRGPEGVPLRRPQR
jgi:hypothetical protein